MGALRQEAVLLNRLYDVHEKKKVQDLLRVAKKRPGVKPTDFSVTGNREDIRQSIKTAIELGYLSSGDLARLVDSVEENGSQHIFLFTLTDEGRRELTAERLRHAFPETPDLPLQALYRDRPTSPHAVFRLRDDVLSIKEVRTFEYWVYDEGASSTDTQRRTVTYQKKRERGVNVFQIDRARGLAEVRIDRVGQRMDDQMALDVLKDFERTLIEGGHGPGPGPIDPLRHLSCIPVSKAFGRILQATDETYMAVDEARSASIIHRISNYRAGTAGKDVRLLPQYDMDSKDYSHDRLNVYWRIPSTGKLVHTILAKAAVPIVGGNGKTVQYCNCGKIYIPNRLEPAELRHVIDRIRHFAEKAP